MISIERTAEDIIQRYILVCQTSLVELLIERGIVTCGDIENANEDEDGDIEPKNIYEWWLVTDWLLHALRGIGEPVLVTAYGNWWGRTVTGQAIIMDGTIQLIAAKMSEAIDTAGGSTTRGS